MKTLCLSGLLLLLTCAGFSQQKAGNFNMVKDNIADYLPPLEELIDSAIAHSASIKFWSTDVQVNDEKIDIAKNQWLKNLKLGSDVRYGTYDNLSLDPIGASAVYTNTTETRYGAFFSVSVPFYDLFNRKNQVAFAELERQQSIYSLKMREQEIRSAIIKQYNQLKLDQQILKLAADFIQTGSVNLQLAQRQFESGMLSLAEYTKIAESYNKSQITYESAKQTFITSLMLLEEMVGYKFNLIAMR